LFISVRIVIKHETNQVLVYSCMYLEIKFRKFSLINFKKGISASAAISALAGSSWNWTWNWLEIEMKGTLLLVIINYPTINCQLVLEVQTRSCSDTNSDSPRSRTGCPDRLSADRSVHTCGQRSNNKWTDRSSDSLSGQLYNRGIFMFILR